MSWLSALWAAILGILRALNARAGWAEDRARRAEQRAEDERRAREAERAASNEVHGDLPDVTVIKRMHDGGF